MRKLKTMDGNTAAAHVAYYETNADPNGQGGYGTLRIALEDEPYMRHARRKMAERGASEGGKTRNIR